MTLSSVKIAHAQHRGLIIMHGLINFFLGVIALAIILLAIGLGALQVLVVTSRAIMALIVLMTIVAGSAIVVVALVAPMVGAIFTTTMLPVA
jgi:hypothetical protein